jgi:creatinine amidohydrolase
MALDTRTLADLRDPEVAAFVDSRETPTALVPVGATEQHGPHLALGTDTVIASEVCRRVADEVDALVAPPVPYGASDEHVGFSVAYLDSETLVEVLKDVAYSLCETGFDDVVFVDGHYTNEAPIQVACKSVSADLPEGKHVYGFPYWETLAPEDAEGYLSLEVGLHANVGETSAVLAVDESLADLSVAEREEPTIPGGVPNRNALVLPVFTGPGTTYRTTESGTWGDPTEASAERGEAYYETIVAAVAAVIETFQAERDRIYRRGRPADTF